MDNIASNIFFFSFFAMGTEQHVGCIAKALNVVNAHATVAATVARKRRRHFAWNGLDISLVLDLVSHSGET